MKKFFGEDMWRPDRDLRKERREKFATLNEFVTRAGGWITSVPGEPLVIIQVLPGSNIPEDLVRLGYRDMIEEAPSERILPAGITEVVSIEGSTAVRTVRHAGLAKVLCFSFSL